MPTIKSFFLLLSATFFLIFSSGCATLPNVSELIEDARAYHKEPKIFSAEGPLSPARSKAIMDQLNSSVEPTDLLGRHLAVMESVSAGPPLKGNKVKLLVDGPASNAAIFKAVRGAKKHINIETYIFEDDETGRKLADLLLQKQAKGVQINLIYDSYGCLKTPASFFQRLRDGGINAVSFNPVNPLKVLGWRITHRDHRKVLIADGKLAITGGVNISNVYSSGSGSVGKEKEKEKKQIPWRDTDVQIEGPAVAEFQKLFFNIWESQDGRRLHKPEYFPHLKEMGKDIVQVIGSTSGEKNRTTFIMYVAAMEFAKNSVHLTNAYFAPDRQMIQALTDAARRGVDVKIIVPAVSDLRLSLYQGQYYYAGLLEAGAKVYERRNAMLHAKTAVVDGVWSTVGSTNLDFWSFASNEELNAVILGDDFASEMEKMFDKDIAESDQIQLEKWKQRPLFPRIKEWIAHLLAPLK